MKRLLPILLALFMAICFCACDDSSKAASLHNSNKMEIKMKDGFNKLQSLYLQIDDSYTEDKLTRIAGYNGLFTETVHQYVMGMTNVYISETEGELGPGAEPWYMFDTDSICVTLFEDEERDNEVYAFSKEYHAIDKIMTVSYTFYDSELYTANTIPGYAEGSYETNENWDSIEDALNYVISKDN